MQAFAAEAAAHGASPPEAFYQAPEFWVAVAFVIMVGAAFRPVLRIAVAALDARASTIRHQIEEARRLRDEAQDLLAQYERKQRDAVKEAEQIVARARRDAERGVAQATADMERALQRREFSALERIAQAEAAAVGEIRALAVDLAIRATHKLLAEHLPAAKSDAMVDEAIAALPGKLH